MGGGRGWGKEGLIIKTELLTIQRDAILIIYMGRSFTYRKNYMHVYIINMCLEFTNFFGLLAKQYYKNARANTAKYREQTSAP